MARRTSRKVYEQIKQEGLLSERRMEVYRCVFLHGPLTAMEAFEKLKLNTNQSGRFTELREMGVLTELGSRKCSITGREAIIWEVTNKLPKNVKTRLSKKDKRILELENALTYAVNVIGSARDLLRFTYMNKKQSELLNKVGKELIEVLK